MNEITPYVCCGETRMMPFCPLCGSHLGIRPPQSIQMGFHIDPAMARRLVHLIGPNFRQSFDIACNKYLDIVVERLLHAGYTRPSSMNHNDISMAAYNKLTKASTLLGISRAELARCCLKVCIDEETG